jgi:hypothetical protein
METHAEEGFMEMRWHNAGYDEGLVFPGIRDADEGFEEDAVWSGRVDGNDAFELYSAGGTVEPNAGEDFSGADGSADVDIASGFASTTDAERDEEN